MLDSYFAVRLIKIVKKIQFQSRLRRIASQPKLLAEWLNECPNAVCVKESDFQSNPEKVLQAFKVLLKYVKPPKDCEVEFDTEVSRMVVFSLGLRNKTVTEVRALFTDPELRARALAYLINEKKIPLSRLDCTMEELMQVAPYLGYVDCRQIPFKDDNEAQEFVKSCSNAYYLNICSDKITELKPSSSKLQALICKNCNSLRKVSLSNQLLFVFLSCQVCTALTELVLSDLPSLEKVYCTGCTSLEELVCANFLELRGFYCDSCKALKNLVLVDLPFLEEVDCGGCSSLSECSFSNLKSLQRLECRSNTALRKLTLLNLPSLQKLYLSFCQALEAIVSDGLPSCRYVDQGNCPNLMSLPELAPNAEVIYSCNCKRG